MNNIQYRPKLCTPNHIYPDILSLWGTTNWTRNRSNCAWTTISACIKILAMEMDWVVQVWEWKGTTKINYIWVLGQCAWLNNVFTSLSRVIFKLKPCLCLYQFLPHLYVALAPYVPDVPCSMSIFLSQGQTVAQGQGEGRVGKVSHVMRKKKSWDRRRKQWWRRRHKQWWRWCRLLIINKSVVRGGKFWTRDELS